MRIEWIGVTQDKNNWRDFVNVMMNFLVYEMLRSSRLAARPLALSNCAPLHIINLYMCVCFLLVGKLNRKKPLGSTRHQWMDSIKVDLRETECGD
jgi:hypothetical protein